MQNSSFSRLRLIALLLRASRFSTSLSTMFLRDLASNFRRSPLRLQDERLISQRSKSSSRRRVRELCVSSLVSTLVDSRRTRMRSRWRNWEKNERCESERSLITNLVSRRRIKRSSDVSRRFRLFAIRRSRRLRERRRKMSWCSIESCLFDFYFFWCVFVCVFVCVLFLCFFVLCEELTKWIDFDDNVFVNRDS